jgi:dipeptide/tripeptide permease
MRDARRRDSRRRRFHMGIRAMQSLIAMIIAGGLAGNRHGGWAAAFFALVVYAMIAGAGGFRLEAGRSRRWDADVHDDDDNANE